MQVRKTCLFRPQGEQTLALMNVETGEVCRISGLGAYIFLKLDGRLNIGEVLDLVCAKFRLSDPMFVVAMDNFIHELFALNILQSIPTRVAGQPWTELFDNKSLLIDHTSLTVDRSLSAGAAAGCGGGCSGSSGGGGGSASAGCAGSSGGGGSAGSGYGGSGGSGGA